jgi:hypothetical protein
MNWEKQEKWAGEGGGSRCGIHVCSLVDNTVNISDKTATE